MTAKPRDASAVILLDSEGRVFWVRRNERMAFQGGYHAFPGGQRESDDAETPIVNSIGPTSSAAVAGVRELFEETGILIAIRGEIDADGRRALRSQLEQGVPFSQLLSRDGLAVDVSALVPAGRWVTPAFSPRRFDTHFFVAQMPAGQEVELGEAELEEGEWILPVEALEKWSSGRVLAAPPVMHAIRTLAGGIDDLSVRFESIPEARGGEVRRIEFRPGLTMIPVRTPTQPPATHTNCYVLGNGEVIVIDPGSPYEDEQQALADVLRLMARTEGKRVKEIVLTHLHPDHVGGVEALRHSLGVPVAAHKVTAEALSKTIQVNRLIHDGDAIKLEGEPPMLWRAVHTPGHARGHLCFFDETTGSLLTGDLVVGRGTVVVDPPEGHMSDYLQSLAKIRKLKPTALFGAHGPAVGNPLQKIDEYVAHRLERERQILAAVASGVGRPTEIVAEVYASVPAKMHGLAERSVLAHLEKLETELRVTRRDDRWVAV